MERKKFQTGFGCLVVGLFLLFVGSLAVMSIFLHCGTNLYEFEHGKTIERHTPLLYCAIAAFGAGLAAAFCVILRRVRMEAAAYRRMSRIVFWCCGALILLMSVFWIFFNDSVPVSDQKDVYAEARRIAGYLDEPFDTGYFSYFPRNRGIVLLVAAVMRIFGDHLWAARLMNLPAVVLLYYSICMAADLIWKKPVVTMLTSFFMMLYYPIVIYTSYVYGTLLSAALCAGGMYAALLFHEKGGARYGALMACAFSAGILAHQSAAIGLCAALLYLLVCGGKDKFKRNLVLIVVSLAVVFLSVRMIDLCYVRITGADPNAKGVPSICTVYMGLSSTEGAAGPGSQDGSYTDIYNENHRDAKAASRDAMQRIGVILQEYMSGERSLTFFLEKIQYQWLDPSFGARRTIVVNDPDTDGANREPFLAFYESPLRTVVFKVTIGFMLMVYFGAAVGAADGLRRMIKSGHCIAPLMLWLYVIGGGAFQLLWESFSRYCFGYFLWLIPAAAYGIYRCCGREKLFSEGADMA